MNFHEWDIFSGSPGRRILILIEKKFLIEKVEFPSLVGTLKNGIALIFR